MICKVCANFAESGGDKLYLKLLLNRHLRVRKISCNKLAWKLQDSELRCQGKDSETSHNIGIRVSIK